MWQVVEFRGGKFYAVVSGLGRNAGTWDSGHTLRTAQKYAAELRKAAPEGVTFLVEKD